MKALFDKYTAAFNQFDSEQIANLYVLPCATSDGDGQDVFKSKTSLIKKFTGVCKQMAEMGYTHSEYKILNQESLGDSACAVTIQWKVFTKTNEIDFYTHYICHKVGNEWKIFTAQVFK